MFGLHHGQMNHEYWVQFTRYLHVFAGILWIGLLYYFNFVQIPTMPKVPAELKPAVSKYIAPAALFWFRWAAVATVLLGLFLIELKSHDYAVHALTLDPTARTIGIGMWLGIIMALNVWLVIWPNQKRALGLVPTDDARKASSASLAMMALADQPHPVPADALLHDHRRACRLRDAECHGCGTKSGRDILIQRRARRTYLRDMGH